MSSAMSAKMGYIDIRLFVFAPPEIKSNLLQMLASLSFGQSPSSQECIYLIFITPDTPQDFFNTIELPEWGKTICKKLLKLSQTIYQSDSFPHFNPLEFVKTVDLNPGDWYNPALQAFFYHRDNQIICFALIFKEIKMQDILINRISGCTYFLAIYWHTLHHGLLLHSAAVAYGKNGYLFLGEGGAGKSTAAFLSISVGACVLSDDLSFVFNKENKIFELAAAPGPASRFTTNPQLHPQLKGIFRIIKANQDKLLPLSAITVANLVFKSFEWSHWVDNLPPFLISRAFHTACDIARKIPGFELHFRKSPDFWKLINEQFF